MARRIIGTDTETFLGFAILITKPHAFCEPQSFEDCIEFLMQDRELACWNADYDCQAVLKWLPAPVRDRLSLLGEVRYKEYRIKYVPHKFMRVWFHSYNGAKERLLFTIYDMRQFYACSLAKAAEKLGVQRKGDIPKSWYTQMWAKLKDPKTRPKVLAYALGDAQTLQQIIDRTAESFAAAGLAFERPFSNASFAERYFRKNFTYRRNKDAEKYARRAYHGGRIECLKAGYFPRAFHYDIHSAYPSAIATLVKPDGDWHYEKNPKEIRPDAIYAFIDCEFVIPRSYHVGPIPIRRRSGAIFYPTGRLRKTVTLTEFRYMERRGIPIRIFSAWVHIWPSWTYPFGEIAEIYKRRKQDAKADYALKIVMNSVYGKMAQILESRIRTNKVDHRAEIFDDRVWRKREKWKEHTSFVYASEITARIRIKLLEDIPPETVISYSTDGVFTTCEVSIPTGSGLGEWSNVEEVRNLVVVGSGVYCYEYEDKNPKSPTFGQWIPEVKFRGFSPGIDLRAMLTRAGRRHFIGLKVLRNTSLKQAKKGGKPSTMNVLERVTRYLDVNFDTKRNWPKKWSAKEITEQTFNSKPWAYYGIVKVRR